MIAVTGATGNVGRHVVEELRTAGAPVRAIVRDPARATLGHGVHVLPGDLRDARTLEPALVGADAAFLVWPFLTADGADAVAAAIAAHAGRVVYLSSAGVRDDAPRQADPINQMHADVERAIRDSGAAWTMLRAGGIATNTLGWADGIASDGVVRWPYADARRSLVHERDIAAVAARALTDPAHAGRTYRLTGPEALSQAEQAAIIGDVIGRPVAYEEAPPEAVAAGLRAEGWPAEVVEGMLTAWARMVSEPEPVSDDVERVTGAPPRSFRVWVRDHAEAFR